LACLAAAACDKPRSISCAGIAGDTYWHRNLETNDNETLPARVVRDAINPADDGSGNRFVKSPGEQILIVPMAEELIPSFWDCLDAVARERRYLALTTAPETDSVREFISAALSRGVPQFVALDGARVIGWCDVFPHDKEGFAHVECLGMGLLREYRRLGIGRQLAVKAIERAKEIGLERIELDVFASNKSAIALYVSLGFAFEGIKRKSRKIDAGYDDMMQMALFP